MRLTLIGSTLLLAASLTAQTQAPPPLPSAVPSTTPTVVASVPPLPLQSATEKTLQTEVARLKQQLTSTQSALKLAYAEIGEREVIISQLQQQADGGVIGNTAQTKLAAYQEFLLAFENANKGQTVDMKTFKLVDKKGETGKGGGR